MVRLIVLAALCFVVPPAEAVITFDFVPTDTSPISAPARRTIAVWAYYEGHEEGFGNFLFHYQASQSGIASAVPAIPAVGSPPSAAAGSTGTGSRYNSPEWDSNTTYGLALRPPSGAIPSAPSMLSFYGSYLVEGDPYAPQHLLGYIVVDITPPPGFIGQFSILATGLEAYSLYGELIPATFRSRATFSIVPEPSAANILLVSSLFGWSKSRSPARRAGLRAAWSHSG